MTNIQPPLRGRRRLTDGHVMARRRSEALDRTRLPSRPAMKTIVMKVGRLFGWPAWAGPTLHALLDFCAGWDRGELVVFPQNARLVHELGICRRAVGARLFRLAELGLIAFRDRPGMRRGRDENGETFGIDLGPLAYLHGEWTTALAADASSYAKLRSASRALKHAIQDVEDLLVLAEHRGRSAESWHAELRAIAGRSDHVVLSGSLSDIEALGAAAAVLKSTIETDIAAPLFPFRPDGVIQAAPLPTSDVESRTPPESRHVNPEKEPSPSASLADGARSKPPLPSGQPSRLTVPLQEIARLAPELPDTIGVPASAASSASMIEAARLHALAMGYHQRDWGDGCASIGRERMMLAVALVLSAMRERPIANPPGLLSWFVRSEADKSGMLIAALRARSRNQARNTVCPQSRRSKILQQ